MRRCDFIRANRLNEHAYLPLTGTYLHQSFAGYPGQVASPLQAKSEIHDDCAHV